MNNVVKKPSSNVSTKKSNLLKKRRNVPGIARAVVNSTLNNTTVCVTDSEGNVILSSSCGACGFKGSRKSTPHAAQVMASELGKMAVELGIRCVSVLVRGVGPGRESAIMALHTAGLKINAVSFDLRLPHNGCRPRKRRRV